GCSNQRIEQALTGSMNKIATLFHPKIYGGTMLLTLNSSSKSIPHRKTDQGSGARGTLPGTPAASRAAVR
ncbi:hypothetical protein, partial [Thiolapillus sp.]|uniref:hypothetical protein n=1 Tax=Thiolapillus sp. TaxID=2017437 RepID=UPI003AF97A94